MFRNRNICDVLCCVSLWCRFSDCVEFLHYVIDTIELFFRIVGEFCFNLCFSVAKLFVWSCHGYAIIIILFRDTLSSGCHTRRLCKVRFFFQTNIRGWTEMAIRHSHGRMRIRRKLEFETCIFFVFHSHFHEVVKQQEKKDILCLKPFWWAKNSIKETTKSISNFNYMEWGKSKNSDKVCVHCFFQKVHWKFFCFFLWNSNRNRVKMKVKIWIQKIHFKMIFVHFLVQNFKILVLLIINHQHGRQIMQQVLATNRSLTNNITKQNV